VKKGNDLSRPPRPSVPGFGKLRRILKAVLRIGTRNEQWARVIMNRETQALVQDLHPGNLEVLEISGSDWGKRMKFKKYRDVHYPEFDICAAPLETKFDLIIAEQVFEHLLWPYRAGKNAYQMLKPGGYLLITTPFLVRVHNHPIDCSRWSETGIKYLLGECGFDLERIRTGSWGNRACIRSNFSGWSRYRHLFHSLRNEADFPIVVWAFAQK
jgi:SAM-dependent methyltransferase